MPKKPMSKKPHPRGHKRRRNALVSPPTAGAFTTTPHPAATAETDPGDGDAPTVGYGMGTYGGGPHGGSAGVEASPERGAFGGGPYGSGAYGGGD